MKRILFVDDEPMVLEALETVLYAQRREWQMVFVTSAAAALAELGSKPFDVVVTDMRMPGRDGADLLAEVARKWPASGRILLTGYADEAAVARAAATAHFRLDKPCPPDSLREAIEDAMP